MEWGKAILQAQTSQEIRPYGRTTWGGGIIEGATKRVMWGDKEILPQGTHVSCVYTVMETLIDAMKLLGFEDKISASDLMLLKEWCFVYAPYAMRSGIAGGFLTLNWGMPVSAKDAELGDFMQFYDVNSNGRDMLGHSVVVMGQSVHDGKPALDTWSAEYKKTNILDWRAHEHSQHTREKYIIRPNWSHIQDYTPIKPVDLFDGLK